MSVNYRPVTYKPTIVVTVLHACYWRAFPFLGTAVEGAAQGGRAKRQYFCRGGVRSLPVWTATQPRGVVVVVVAPMMDESAAAAADRERRFAPFVSCGRASSADSVVACLAAWRDAQFR